MLNPGVEPLQAKSNCDRLHGKRYASLHHDGIWGGVDV